MADERWDEKVSNGPTKLVDRDRPNGIQLPPYVPAAAVSKEPNQERDPLEFHIGDAILKIMTAKGYNRARLAKESKHRRNTIGALIAQAAETEPATIEDVLRVLDVDRAFVEALVQRMNGQTQKITQIRPPDVREREMDKDPVKREAAEFGLRIASLPSEAARMAIYNVVRAFESAFIGPRIK